MRLAAGQVKSAAVVVEVNASGREREGEVMADGKVMVDEKVEMKER